MNKRKTENYLDWLHKLRKEKSKLSVTERLGNFAPAVRTSERKQLKKAA